MFNSISFNNPSKNIYAKSQKPSFGMAYRERGMDYEIGQLTQAEHDRYVNAAKKLDKTSNRYGFDIDVVGSPDYYSADLFVRSKKNPRYFPDEAFTIRKGDFQKNFPAMASSLETKMAQQKERIKIFKEIMKIGR